MKKIAIRGVSGIWVYYITQLRYDEVDKLVNSDGNEMHSSKKLSDLIQRALTQNVDNIKEYILNEKEKFFNALVLAVYDGDPQWNEYELKDDKGDDVYNFGYLEFDGNVKVFAVDGQHRVQGIKKALETEKKNDLIDETIPAIFVAHKCDPEGVRRTRRLFTTLNKYAKPVSERDIIALDEDDIYAISTRYVIDNCVLFSDGIIDLKSMEKNLKPSDQTHFTNIVTLFQCNKELINAYLEKNEVLYNKKRVLGKEYLKQVNKYRLDDKYIEAINKYLKDFWDAISNKYPFTEYLKTAFEDEESTPALKWRNKENGGNALFRPIFLVPFITVLCKKYMLLNDMNKAIDFLFLIDLNCNSKLWNMVLWNTVQKKIERPSKTIIESILFYLIDIKLSENKENNLLEFYQKITNNYSMTIDEMKKDLNNFKIKLY